MTELTENEIQEYKATKGLFLKLCCSAIIIIAMFMIYYAASQVQHLKGGGVIMKLKSFQKTELKYCEKCKKETRHKIEYPYERWQDKSIPDEELSPPEVISRQNNEPTYLETCLVCRTEGEYS